jgi:hypothetical protein
MTNRDVKPETYEPGVWYDWSGGSNPVPGRVVKVRYRNGKKDKAVSGQEGALDWNDDQDPYDIIAFRLVSEAADKGSLQPPASVPGEGHGTGVVGWQPIETAPKDGTPVLAFGFTAGEINGPGDCEAIEVATYEGPGGDWPGFDWSIAGDAYANWIAPTHWMPLPPPPAASVSMGTSRKASEPKDPASIPALEGGQ